METPGSVLWDAYVAAAKLKPMPFEKLPSDMRAALEAAAEAVKLRYGAIY
jgi:hypothetical protein